MHIFKQAPDLVRETPPETEGSLERGGDPGKGETEGGGGKRGERVLM